MSVEDERLRSADAVHAAHAAAAASSFAPLVALGTEILKAVALINGGAGIATLWFVAATLREDRALAFALVLPLVAFGFGLTVAACATGWSYLSHAQHAQALKLQDWTWSAPFVADTDESRAARQAGDRYQRFAFGAVLVGIASAVVGFCLAGAVLLTMLR